MLIVVILMIKACIIAGIIIFRKRAQIICKIKQVILSINIGSESECNSSENDLELTPTPQIPSLYPQLTIEPGNYETHSLPAKPLFSIGLSPKRPKT